MKKTLIFTALFKCILKHTWLESVTFATSNILGRVDKYVIDFSLFLKQLSQANYKWVKQIEINLF